MSWRLFVQTLAWNRVRLIVVVLAGIGWGVLLPTIYVSFSSAIKALANSGAIPQQFTNFGSGSIFNLPGTLTLGLQHPLAVAFVGIFAIGSAASAVAGERERGTLEVLLARPLSRRRVFLTVAAAVAVMSALALGAVLAGEVAGVLIQGLSNEVDLALMGLVFINGLLLWAAFAAFALAASVSFDRLGPALGLALAYLLINYFLEVLGSLWLDVAWSQEYSLFHHFNAGEILRGEAQPIDFVILGVAVLVPMVYALVVFPRRDLAAPA
jgi:ABC-2 type transport system permease protein